MKKIGIWALGCLLGVALLAGCATEPPPLKIIPPRAERESMSRFMFTSRISVKQGQKVQNARMAWTHAKTSDSVGFSTSMGITLAELQRDEKGARWLAADGEKYEARSADMLMAKITSEPVPLETLALWVLGRTSSMASNVKKDELGRLMNAEDNGWYVSIDAYETELPNALPSLVTVSHGVVQVKIFIEDWDV